jgi:hypothetical protein
MLLSEHSFQHSDRVSHAVLGADLGTDGSGAPADFLISTAIRIAAASAVALSFPCGIGAPARVTN